MKKAMKVVGIVLALLLCRADAPVSAQVYPGPGTGGGSVTIGDTQVAYATAANTLGGSANLTFAGGASLVVNNGASAVSPFTVQDNGTPVITVADGGATTFTQPATFAAGSRITPSVLVGDTNSGAYAFTTGWVNIAADATDVAGFTSTSLNIAKPIQFGLVNAYYVDQFAFLKALTESSATAFVALPLTTLVPSSGELQLQVMAADGTDYQVRNATIRWMAANKAGTETCKLIGTAGTAVDSLTETEDGSVLLESAGASTLTYTINTDESAANSCSLTISAVSSLAQTSLNAYWHITRLNHGTITPQ